MFKELTSVRQFIAPIIIALLFLFMGNPAGAQPIETSSNDLMNLYASMEEWLGRPARTKEEIKTGSAILADKYITDERYQEAIWVLRSGGHFARARELERWLTRLLSEVKTEFIRKFETGKEGAKLYRVEGTGIYVVEKPRAAYQGGTEVVASRMNQLLGLDLVPTTVEAKNSEGTVISRQYFVRDSVTAAAVASEEMERSPELKQILEASDYGEAFNYRIKASWDHLRSKGYPFDLRSIWLLDYLLDNGDRHGSNWLKLFGKKNGKSIAIDHGLCLGGCVGSDWKRKAEGPIYSDVEFNENNLPSKEVLKKLETLTPKKLRTEFSDFISEKQIEGILLRKERVVAATRKKYSSLSCKDIFSGR